MAKLRHIALAVRDLEESAKFYENAFGMERVRESDVAVMMSDGVMSLALLYLPTNENTEPDERGRQFIGLHHMGFLTDDMATACAHVEAAGGTFHGHVKNVGVGEGNEAKYLDPNGIVLDVANHLHREKSWCEPDS